MTRSVVALARATRVCAASRADFMLQFSGFRSGSLSGSVSYSYTGTDNIVHSGIQTNIHFAELSMSAVGQGAGGSNLAFETFSTNFLRSRFGSFSVREVGLTANPGSNAWPAMAPQGGWLGGGMAYLYHQYLGLASPSVTDAAEYQLAIWRLSLGNGANLTSGNSTLDSSASSLYNSALSHLGEGGYWLQGTQFRNIQGILYPGEGDEAGIQAAPAPGVVVLLSSGGLFFGLFGAVRRRIGGQRS